MGDYVYTSIKFGGKITANQARTLSQALNVPFEQLFDAKPIEFESVNYGILDPATYLASEIGLSYVHRWARGTSFDAAIAIYTPETGYRDICDTEANGPAVSLREILFYNITDVVEYL